MNGTNSEILVRLRISSSQLKPNMTDTLDSEILAPNELLVQLHINAWPFTCNTYIPPVCRGQVCSVTGPDARGEPTPIKRSK